MVYSRGESLTLHISQMKLWNAITAAAVISSSFINANPAKARNGWIHTNTNDTASRYIKITKRSGRYTHYLVNQSNLKGEPLARIADCSNYTNKWADESQWKSVMPGSIAEYEMENYLCRK